MKITDEDKNEQFNDWVNENAETLLEEYIDTLTFDDMPESVISEIATDEVDEWDMPFQNWCDTLTIDQVPDDFCSNKYDSYLEDGGREE